MSLHRHIIPPFPDDCITLAGRAKVLIVALSATLGGTVLQAGWLNIMRCSDGGCHCGSWGLMVCFYGTITAGRMAKLLRMLMRFLIDVQPFHSIRVNFFILSPPNSRVYTNIGFEIGVPWNRSFGFLQLIPNCRNGSNLSMQAV